jgi:NitT/TauT family transport system permease protein
MSRSETDLRAFIPRLDIRQRLRKARSNVRNIRVARTLLLQVAILGSLVLMWEVAGRLGWAEPFVYGQPSAFFAYLWSGFASGMLFIHASVTLLEQVLGLLIGTALGTGIGLALWWSTYFSRVFEPYAVILNATPKIVIAPLLVVWFGIGLASKIMIAVMITFVVAWLGAFEGVKRADKDQQDLVRALGASEWNVFKKVVLPSCGPAIFATLRMNVGLSLIGVITGEFLSSTHGLGYLVASTAKTYQMSHTLAAIAVLAGIAAIELWIISRAERRWASWA